MPRFTNGLTANYNNYSATELEKALSSWVDPYPKPIILNHDLNTEPIGRVMAAKMDKEEDGSPFVRLQIAITDPVAAQKVLDKRYLTGSVGGRAGKAICSISGEDLAAESAGRPPATKYRRGQVYKGKLAYIDMQDISFKEYSFVNQPADGKSGVRSTSVISDKEGKPSSEDWVAKSSAFVLHMNEEDIYSLSEHESMLKDMKKKESKPLYLQVKGAFLSAMAVQESENYNNQNDSLLSNKDEIEDSYQENSNMKDEIKQDDVLAAVEELSEDLSAIAAAAKASEENTEEQPSEEAPAEEEVTEESDEVKSEESTEVAIDEQVSTAASAVQSVLNDSIVFAIAAQRAHWNVTGEYFEQYHALFGAIYEDVFDSIDSIAEEIRKMDVMVESLTNMVMNASFKDDATSSDPMELCQSLLEKNNALNERVLAAFTTCSEVNAQGTADLLAARDGMHKKWAWQLKASLSEDAGEPADESWREFGSSAKQETKEELSQEVDSSGEGEAVENKKDESSKAELTDSNAVSEQNAVELEEKFHLLEEENKKLRSALHRTLAERVVDSKIAAGIESVEDRDSLIEDHVSRSAASLADSLRDLAKMPVSRGQRSSSPEIDFEASAVEGEDNVTTLDKEDEEVKEQKETPMEQLFVDALMGRRKL